MILQTHYLAAHRRDFVDVMNERRLGESRRFVVHIGQLNQHRIIIMKPNKKTVNIHHHLKITDNPIEPNEKPIIV